MSQVTGTVSDPDSILFQDAAGGDVAAFDRLMRRYNQRMYRTARSILHNEMDAEEAVQEAWWKAYNHLQDFRGDARPTTWLTRIVVNEALMLARRNKSRAAVIQSIEPTAHDDAIMPSHNPSTVVPATAQPDQQAWRAELRALIEQQIDALPDLYRAVFMLRGVEDMPSAEVAAILDLSEATVRVRYMRARRLLQDALKAHVALGVGDAFSFAGARCDRIVAGVHRRMREAGVIKD